MSMSSSVRSLPAPRGVPRLALPRAAADFPPGYDVLAPAGMGTFCELWKVRDAKSRRPLALKRLREERRDDAGCRQLLAKEAEVAAAVASPYVIRLDSAEFAVERPHLLLEWLEGATLEDNLARSGRLSAGTAVWILRQSVQGLRGLSAAGYAHGDLKPANIFLTRRGGLKLIDLGFARRLDSAKATRAARHLVGTAEYMAPEELSPGPFNPLTKDLYSLGVTLFRMLAGRLPFVAENTAEMLRLQRQAKPPSLRCCCPGIPSRLDELARCLLAKQPIRRPQCLARLVSELVELELETLAEGEAAAG